MRACVRMRVRVVCVCARVYGSACARVCEHSYIWRKEREWKRERKNEYGVWGKEGARGKKRERERENVKKRKRQDEKKRERESKSKEERGQGLSLGRNAIGHLGSWVSLKNSNSFRRLTERHEDWNERSDVCEPAMLTDRARSNGAGQPRRRSLCLLMEKTVLVTGGAAHGATGTERCRVAHICITY